MPRVVTNDGTHMHGLRRRRVLGGPVAELRRVQVSEPLKGLTVNEKRDRRDSLGWKIGYYVVGPAFTLALLGLVVWGVLALFRVV